MPNSNSSGTLQRSLVTLQKFIASPHGKRILAPFLLRRIVESSGSDLDCGVRGQSLVLFTTAKASPDESCPMYNTAMPFRPQGNPNAVKRGRTPPPEDTLEEAAFLKSLGEKKKAVNFKLMDGEAVP